MQLHKSFVALILLSATTLTSGCKQRNFNAEQGKQASVDDSAQEGTYAWTVSSQPGTANCLYAGRVSSQKTVTGPLFLIPDGESGEPLAALPDSAFQPSREDKICLDGGCPESSNNAGLNLAEGGWKPMHGVGKAIWYGLIGPVVIGAVVTIVGGNLSADVKADLGIALAAVGYGTAQIELLQSENKSTKLTDDTTPTPNLAKTNPSSFDQPAQTPCSGKKSSNVSASGKFTSSLSDGERQYQDALVHEWNALSKRNLSTKTGFQKSCKQVIDPSDLCG